jgi:hypothetical protein
MRTNNRTLMLRCPTCNAENDSYALICTNCRGYLQNRVPNLDLFETVWGVVESPPGTFRRIALAEHKNYSFVLFTGLGVAIMFTLFWLHRFGNVIDSIPGLLGAGLAAGIVVGPILGFVLPGVAHLVLTLSGVKVRFRNSLAALAYAVSPVVSSVVIILPIELALFGMYLFTSNPSPYALKPVAYVMLIGFDSLLALWSILLGVVGLKVVHQTSWARAAIAVVAVLGVLAALGWASSMVPWAW